MTQTTCRFWAFLSYCSHDRATAHWLHRALETYVVPRYLVGLETPGGPAPRQFRPIFRDRTDLPADTDLKARIGSALADCAYLIVVCSEHAARSRWVNEEILRFRELHGDGRVFTVIAEGSGHRSHQDCFPPALRYRADAGEEIGPEPIAADLRPRGDGKRTGLLKLVAGMLGVGLDELVRRDRQRRQRRLIAMTAASVAGMAITGALAIAAVLARNEAQKQRSHAEGLIEFMLTDLRKQLEPSGRLAALDGAGREALAYYSAQDPRHLDDQSLSRRARALRLMGEITIQRGETAAALTNFQQASLTTGELLARSPNDGPTIFNHAQNVFWVGEIARQRGDLATAEASFRQYRSLADRLVSINGADDNWRAEVGYAEGALGALYLQEGRAQEAASAFVHDLAAADELARRHPEDLNRQTELGQAHAWTADALEKLGRLASARSHREQELAIYRTILAKDPTVRQAQESSLITLQILGRLALVADDSATALTYLQDAAARGETLLREERDNVDLSTVVASAHTGAGEVLLGVHRIDEARSAQERADALLFAALAHDATVERWRTYRDRSQLLRAAILAQAGHPADALPVDEEELRTLADSGAGGSNTERFWLLQRARLQTGQVLSELGKPAAARAHWSAIVQSLSGPLESYEPKLLLVLSAALRSLGDDAAARRVSDRLALLAGRTPA